MFRTRAASFLVTVMFLLVGCGGQMGDQPRCDPLEASDFFEDGQCSRHLPPNTVARGQLEEDALLYTGQEGPQEAVEEGSTGAGDDQGGQEELVPQGNQAGEPPQYSAEYPYPVTIEMMERGQERYAIYCAPCHSLDGEGDGMIVRRGFPQPPSLHIDRLREAPPGYVFDVITNGIGAMPSYSGQIREVSDRWAIVAYIQALQLSQNATLEDVPEDERATIGDAPEEEQETEGDE